MGNDLCAKKIAYFWIQYYTLDKIMIPKLNESGVLPPFFPESAPTIRADVAPYLVSLTELVQNYATTNTRKRILIGYLEYRKSLKKIGINTGFQWIDGSFTEDVEQVRKRGPSDIDLLTFAFRPDPSFMNVDLWGKFIEDHKQLFYPKDTKENFLCDAYYIDLNMHPVYLVKNISYWHGLFSHQKETFLWKGMLEIDLAESEDGLEDLLSLEAECD